MSRQLSKYKIYFLDGTQVETPYCKLRLAVKGDLLFQEDPSTYGEGIVRTFVMANVKYWEPID